MAAVRGRLRPGPRRAPVLFPRASSERVIARRERRREPVRAAAASPEPRTRHVARHERKRRGSNRKRSGTIRSLSVMAGQGTEPEAVRRLPVRARWSRGRAAVRGGGGLTLVQRRRRRPRGGTRACGARPIGVRPGTFGSRVAVAARLSERLGEHPAGVLPRYTHPCASFVTSLQRCESGAAADRTSRRRGAEAVRRLTCKQNTMSI